MDNDASNYRSRSDASRRLFGDRPSDEVATREAEPTFESEGPAFESPFSRDEPASSERSAYRRSRGDAPETPERPSASRASIFDRDPAPRDADRGFSSTPRSTASDGTSGRSEGAFDSPRETVKHGFDRLREKTSIFDREPPASGSLFSRGDEDRVGRNDNGSQRESTLRGGYDSASNYAPNTRREETAPRLDRLGDDVPPARRSFDAFGDEPAPRERQGSSGYSATRSDESAYDRAPQTSYGRERDAYEAPADDKYAWDAGSNDDGYQGLHAQELASVDEAYAREYEYTDESVDYKRAEPSGYEEFGQFDEQYDEYPDNRRRRGPFLLLGSLIGVAAIAGGLILVYNQGVREGQNDVVVLEAPVDPAKLEPTEPSGLQVSGRTKLIYDRIIGEATITDETFESREEPLLDPNAQALTNGDDAIGLSESGQTTGSQSGETSGSEPLPLPLPPPPSVSTDNQQSGTLLSNGETQVATGEQPISLEPPTTQDPSLPSTVIQPPSGDQPTGLVAPEQAAAVEEDLPDQIAQLITSPPLPQDKPVPPSRLVESAPAVPTGEVEANALPGSVPRDDAQDGGQSGPTPLILQPAQQETLESAEPPTQNTNLGDQIASVLPDDIAPQPEAAPAPLVGGRYVVQLASYSSAAEAQQEFARLQSRHGTILANYQSLIEEADLGSRGIYHRLLVGPMEQRASASQLCNSLISAGERDCFVRER